MVTGSHNPPDYNGLKMVIDGTTLSGDDIQALRTRIERGDLATRQRHACAPRTSRRPTSTASSATSSSRGRCTSPSTAATASPARSRPTLYRRLGCDVVELFCDVDGHFPNHHPDPSQPKNLHDLIAGSRRAIASSASRSTATATASASSRAPATSSIRTAS